MKRLALIFCCLFLIPSCEEDDICTEKTTPRLLISFVQDKIKQNPDSLIIYRQNNQGSFDLINKSLAMDSIFIALPVDNRKETKLILGKSSQNVKHLDTLSIQYDYNLRFVSKACGYGVQYLNTKYSMTNQYFNSIETLQNEITHENTPHIKLHY